MRASVRAAAALALALAAWPVRAQQLQPLRKSDLVRLLSGSALGADEVTGLIKRNCLTFTPTGRDRADFTALGASPAVLREIDGCVRRAAPRAAAAPPRRDTAQARAPAPRVRPRPALPVAAPAAAAPPAAPVAPPGASRADAAHSAWEATSMRGTAGQRLAVSLVFTARDSSGAPLAAVPVTLTGTNATLDAASVVTDALGRTAISVTFGAKPLPAVITASVGPVALPITILPATGTPARLALSCGDQTLAGLLVLSAGSRVALGVRVLDSFDTPVAAGTVEVAAADERVLKVGVLTPAAGAASVDLEPQGGGTTVLAVSAAGLKRSLTAAVLSEAVPGVVPCASPTR